MTSGQGGSFFAALLFTLATVLAVPPGNARAQDFSPGAISKSYPYKDLPGVPDQAQKKLPVEKVPDCTRELRMRTLRPLDRLDRFNRDAPVSVYSCEQNGFTIQSEQAPIPKTWNPLDLR